MNTNTIQNKRSKARSFKQTVASVRNRKLTINVCWQLFSSEYHNASIAQAYNEINPTKLNHNTVKSLARQNLAHWTNVQRTHTRTLRRNVKQAVLTVLDNARGLIASTILLGLLFALPIYLFVSMWK